MGNVQCANIIRAVCILWAGGWWPFDAPAPPRFKLFALLFLHFSLLFKAFLLIFFKLTVHSMGRRLEAIWCTFKPPPPRIKLFACTRYQSDQKDCNTLTLKPIFQSLYFRNHRVSPFLQRKAYLSAKLDHVIHFTHTRHQQSLWPLDTFLLSDSKKCWTDGTPGTDGLTETFPWASL